ncbi:Protein DJ-1 B [Trebouxia sp. C0009 RCD-2024]
MEAVTIIDVLRRAGSSVTVASVESELEVKCSRDVKIVADVLMSEAAKQQYDLIVLPGGAPGSEALKRSEDLKQLLHKQQSSNRAYAAMCAAPAVVLEAHGLLEGKKATAHPAFVDKLSDSSAAEQRVVVDGNLITSRGPGTALEFALALVEQLYSSEKAKEVAGPMVVHDSVGSFMHT